MVCRPKCLLYYTVSCSVLTVFCSFSGLFENRHGWTVQLHDNSYVYEVGGYDSVLDLISELEVPPGMPHTVTPFLVSACESPTDQTAAKDR